MCRAVEHGGRRCGALAHTRAEGNQVRDAAKEAVAESERAKAAAAAGNLYVASRAARVSYDAYKRADAAQAAAHEAVKRATTERAQRMSAGSAKRATLVAARAAKAAKDADAAVRSATAKAAARGVLGGAETAERVPCRGCGTTGKVVDYDENDNPLGEFDCVMCDGKGTVAA